MPSHIFVYGTLRRAASSVIHHEWLDGCVYVANGWMRGRLYEISHYPGAVESQDLRDKVVGEVYKLDTQEALDRLDQYEECSASFPEPHEYSRKIVEVTIGGDESVLAWAYIFNREVVNLQQIKSGDYLEFIESKTGDTTGMVSNVDV
ncbi:MAG: gamma-glutamylcyclotransferase family protein [Pseudomonadota bacterium]